MLTTAASILQKVAYRQNLTADETQTALDLIGDEDVIVSPERSEGFYFLALTFGLMAKGPTAEELFGFVQSISRHSVKFDVAISPDNIIDVSGTGGDKIKTFNVSSTVGFVVASAGIYVAKQATRSYTGLTGSADLYRELGLDPFRLDTEDLLRCLHQVKHVAFYTPQYSAAFENRMNFLLKLKNLGLSYPTPWHLVAWVYSPFRMNARIYGVFDRRFVQTIAVLFKRLGYKRVLVVHGSDGLDEVSNLGETYIAELLDGEIQERVLFPEDFNIRRAKPSEIQTLTDSELTDLHDPHIPLARKEDLKARGYYQNIKSFFEVIYNKERGPKRDLVLMNAGAALYLSRKAESIADGIILAASLIDKGKAREKLYEFARFADSINKLKSWEKQIGL